MPELKDISYSLPETISTIHSYYHFLTQMYLPPSSVTTPPPTGWPSITPRSAVLSKSPLVITLLRHLPYLQSTSSSSSFSLDTAPDAAPNCKFADWNQIFTRVVPRHTVELATSHRLSSETDVPAHVIGLTFGGSYTPRFLLDVELGTVLWSECPGEIDDAPLCETVDDDPYNYCETEGEAEWRAEGRDWAIKDFFEELKGRFRRLDFVPLGEGRVVSGWMGGGEEWEEMVGRVREVFWGAGWPDLERYDKEGCLEGVRRVVGEYPQFAG